MAQQPVCLLPSSSLSHKQRQILEPALAERGARVLQPSALRTELLARHAAPPEASRILLVVPDDSSVTNSKTLLWSCAFAASTGAASAGAASSAGAAPDAVALFSAALSGVVFVRQAWAHAAVSRKVAVPLLCSAEFAVAAPPSTASVSSAAGGPPPAKKPRAAREACIVMRDDFPAGFALACDYFDERAEHELMHSELFAGAQPRAGESEAAYFARMGEPAARRHLACDSSAVPRWPLDVLATATRDGLCGSWIVARPTKAHNLLYLPGGTMQPHADSWLCHGAVIFGVTLGAPAVLTLSKERCKDSATKIELPRRSIYALTGAARRALTREADGALSPGTYLHSISKVNLPDGDAAAARADKAWNPLCLRASITLRAPRNHERAVLQRLRDAGGGPAAPPAEQLAAQLRQSDIDGPERDEFFGEGRGKKWTTCALGGPLAAADDAALAAALDDMLAREGAIAWWHKQAPPVMAAAAAAAAPVPASSAAAPAPAAVPSAAASGR